MGKKFQIAFSLIVLIILPLPGQQHPSLKIIFAGDIMGHDTQIASALAMGSGAHYDYSSCFKYIEPYIRDADIAIGNLEVTFGGPPYKGYPAFSSPDALAIALKTAGFDILVNANNHALDKGTRGLNRTLSVLDTAGLVQTGVFRDSISRVLTYPLIVEKKGIRLAILNYTYGTNGIPVRPPSIVNYIDTTLIKKDLLKAETAAPDYIIAMMHWGNEYELKENSFQRSMADFLVRNGTDAVIGSHPHVVQPMDIYPENKLVAWSKGNLISNMRKRYTDGGIIVEMTIEKRDSVTTITDYSYLPVWVDKVSTARGTMFRLLPAHLRESEQDRLGMTTEAKSKMKIFLDDTRKNLPGIPEAGLEWFPGLIAGSIVQE